MSKRESVNTQARDLWRLVKLLAPYKHWVLLGIMLTTLTLLANVILMSVSGWFIASMAIAGLAGVSMNYFSPAAIIRASAILRTGGRYAERLVTHEATFRLLSVLRVWFYRRLEPLVPAILEEQRSGDLLSRITADIDILDNFYVRVLAPVSAALIVLIIITVYLTSVDSLIALLVCGLMLVAGVVMPVLTTHLGYRPGRLALQRAAMMRTHVIDGVQGLAELSVFGALCEQQDRVRIASKKLHQSQDRLNRIAGLSQTALILLTNLAMWLVVFFVVPLVNAKNIQPEQLAMLALLTLAVFEAVMPLPEAFRLLGQILEASRRLFGLVDRRPAVAEPVSPCDKPDSFDIRFDSVKFRYGDNNDLVLDDFNLLVPAGSKVAVVGETGIGKSTLFQLLLHYREVNSGFVMLGEHPVSDYSSEQLHDWFAVATQQVYLFNSSIRNNLLIARPDADEDDLMHACRVAQLDDFIQQQPDGLDTWVGETGIKVSGGQARRIAIARTMLRNFDCLILDEPGEGLDPLTEQRLLSSILDELGDRSLLLITHSQAGLSMMDQVVTMQQDS